MGKESKINYSIKDFGSWYTRIGSLSSSPLARDSKVSLLAS